MLITSATFNLTRRCNSNCKYCFNWRESGTEYDMSPDVAKRAIDFLFENAMQEEDSSRRKVTIGLWGGEPLLAWDLIVNVVVPYAEKKSEETGVLLEFNGTTNGILLTEDKFDFLDEHRVYFMISLDGTEKSHSLYRRGWKETVENTKKALERWSFYKVRQSIVPDVMEWYFDDLVFLVDLGVNDIMFSPVYELEWSDRALGMFEEAIMRFVEEVIVPEFKRGRKIRIEHLVSNMGNVRRSWEFPCGAGKGYVGIDYDGAIYPCHRFTKFNDTREWYEKEVCIGHIDYGITNPTFREFFLKPVPWVECRQCELWGVSPCFGGCYAVVWDFLQSFDKGPYEVMCRYQKIMKKLSKWFEGKLREEGLLQQYLYGEQVKVVRGERRGCVCYNMCYAEGTPDEIVDIDFESDVWCLCNMARYVGPMEAGIAKPVAGLTRVVLEKLKKLEDIVSKLGDRK